MKPALYVLPILTVSLVACSDAASEDELPPNNNASLAQEPDAAKPPTGYFRVTTLELPPTCSGERFPSEDALALIDAGGAGFRVGGFALSNVAPGEFAGCDAEPVDGEFTPRYQAASAVITSADDGQLAVEVTIDDVFDQQAGECPGFAMTLEPIGDCDPTGRFVAATQTVDGACDLEWAPAQVAVDITPEGYAIDWGGTEYDATFDEETCTLHAAEGLTEAYLYNGAVRQVSLSLRIDGVTARAEIEDVLEGEAIDGKTCERSTISVVLERPSGFDENADLLAAACDVPRPPSCGDGVCEASETCATCVADCGCSDGEECTDEGATNYFCRAFCDEVTSVAQCGDGRRCGVLLEPSMVIYPEDETFCLPSAGREEGEVCERLADCADGLLCHRPLNAIRQDLGVCSRPCDSSGACGDGYVCELASGEFSAAADAIAACGWTCAVLGDDCPGADTVCSGEGGGPNTCVAGSDPSDAVGQSCSRVGDPCPDGLYCSFSECVQVCDTDSDCGADGTCDSVGVFGQCT